MKNTELFHNLDATLAKSLFEETTYPWEVLPRIKDFVKRIGYTLPIEEYERMDDYVWVHRSAFLYPGAYIGGPTIIGADSEVRPGAFLRGSILVGKNCVVGNATELKNAILFDNVQVPHYNYVGDSILGNFAHMGAGSICSNVKSDKKNIVVHGEEELETGLRKFGAILGDHADIGCNSVLCPGTVIGTGARVYPLSRVRGVVKPYHIYKNENEVVEIR